MAFEDTATENDMPSVQPDPAELAGTAETAIDTALPTDGNGIEKPAGTQQPESRAADETQLPSDQEANDEGDRQGKPELASGVSSDRGLPAKPSPKAIKKEIAVDAESSAVAIGEYAKSVNTKVEIRESSIQQLTVQHGETEKPSLVPVSGLDQKRIAEVFVAPADFHDACTSIADRNERVAIVYGAEQSGKYACAVKLALDLSTHEAALNAPEPKIEVYRRTARDRYSLLDFAHHEEVKAGTTYIVEDAFENGVRLGDLTGPALSALTAALAQKGNRLLLTTEYNEAQLANLPVVLVSTSVTKAAMLEVLQKHLSHYRRRIGERGSIPEELIELADRSAGELVENFRVPPQVEIFCGRLRGLSAHSTKDVLVSQAQRVRELGEEPRSWFQKLPENARLYAMLAVLFSSVDRYVLDEIYLTSVYELRLQGVANLRDPREQGMNDLLDQIHAREDEVRRVRFDSQALEREARWQIDNHRHLLWSLVNLILATIENYRAPEYWEFRNALGAAIGALGIYQPSKLKDALEKLADHPSGGVVAVVGYALDQVCRSDIQHHSFVINLLEDWARSGDRDRMWAVPASIWRLYDGLALSVSNEQDPRTKAVASDTLARTHEILTLLAEHFDQFNSKSQRDALRLALGAPSDAVVNLDEKHPFAVVLQYFALINEWALDNVGSVLHAIRQMSRNHAQEVVKLLGEWLRSENESQVREIAVLAGYQLFYENSSSDLVLTAERHAPLFDLIGPLLTADASAAEVVMQALLQWLRSPGWSDRVLRALLRVANRANEQEATTLRTVLLNEWLNSDLPDAHRIASSVVGRLYVMRGTPMDMPGGSLAVIALDASPEARRGRSAARWGYLLHARLDALIDTWVLRMGQREPLAQPGRPKPSSQLQPDYPRPRLLATALDSLNTLCAFDPLKVSIALVLAWQPPLDAEDLIGGSWPERILVEAAGWPKTATLAGASSPDNNAERRWWSDVMNVSADSPNPDDIEDVMLRHLARRLSARSPDEWWQVLCESLNLPQDDATRIVERLTAWTTLLEDEQQAAIARTILCSVLWLSTASPTQCVALLNAWLDSPDELTKLTGAACGTAVFRLYGECQPSPDLERYSVLLGIAPSLAKAGWSRLKAVIEAARQWSGNPGWAARLLTQPDGSVGEMVQMVDSLPQSDRTQLEAELTKWLEDTGSQKDPYEGVRKLVHRMQVQLALTVRASLPELPADHTYVMLVLDHADGNSKIRHRIAGVASRLIEKVANSPQDKVHVLTYRLGHDVPIVGPNERPTVEQFEILDQPLCPRTIGPLLELHSTKQIGAVVLLVDCPPIDAEDLVDTEWRDRVLMYSVVGRRYPTPTLPLVPQPDQRTAEETEDIIIRSLRQVIGA